ncbi:hypothetical protein MNV49_004409 [Pseudohyphozyma bogoriensis]|nr:hypothetical protein MNV49_004409 [Pseudohyphozyma bogoriensis]
MELFTATGKAKAARGRRASSVPLPESDSDEDFERPAQRQRITFTIPSTFSFDKAAQLDGGDRAADLPARDGAFASKGGVPGTFGKGAQEDLAESASGDEVVPKSDPVDYKALAAEQAKTIAEHQYTIAKRGSTIKEIEKEDRKKVMEARSLRATIALGRARYKDCARGTSYGAAVINLALSFEAGKRLILVTIKLVADYAASQTPPIAFPYQEYIEFGRALEAEHAHLRYSKATTIGYGHPANVVIHQALWHECAKDPERITDFNNGAQASRWMSRNRKRRNNTLHFNGKVTLQVFTSQPWLKMKPAQRVAWEQRMKKEVVVVGGSPFKRDYGTVIDPDPAGGDSQEILDALAIQDNTFQWWV